ncbi:4Fe-4S dicluster domain-containing protein [Adlercreutzia faecimuris]|uniref:4Fe-4S dicluster domain-containing protein n=1 Tax=Adlercreutzia faecimuris TaxID=2897341 RepID=A0ABS9WEE5_9ACTN|nr:4Fe-4S dicluster domain-containing protein [Adlercreutzia sp. JBNU-10]MCI2241238.1 4Fe-4S dicluster domain-containing protein [Adlercreutzia sp. JBNU-10]
MANYGMLINTKKCIGCYACRTACQRQNNLLPDEAFIRFEEREVGTYPSVRVEHVPLQCMHCEDAPCVSVCPTGAAKYGTDGIVEVDQGRCIGCLYCVAACPYQVRVRNSQTGAVDKCRFCTVAADDGTKMCSCVEACLTGCRIFGDLDDPNSEISKAIIETGAAPIAGDLTKAKIYYVR